MIKSRQISFKGKLLLFAGATTAAALTVCCAAVLSAEWINARRELPRDLAIVADVIANNVVAALMFEDKDAAEETLGGLKADTNIVYARITKPDGIVFATYATRENQQIVLHSTGTGQHEFSGGVLHINRPIRMERDTLGAIYVQYDLREFYGRLFALAWILLGAMAAALGGSVIVASRLQRTLTRPISELSATSQGIARKNDYSVRATKYSDDELGTLTDAFNEMIARIELRDRELQESRATLEQRVHSRTESLLRQERFQAALATLGRFAIRQNDLKASVEFALQTVTETLNVPLCEIFCTIPGDDKLVLRAGVGWAEELIEQVRIRVSLDEQIGFTIDMDRTVVVEDHGRETRFGTPVLLKEAGVVSGMTIPVRGKTGLYGVLGVHCREPRVFTEDEVCYLESVANVISETQQKFHAAEQLAVANGQLEAVRTAMLGFIGQGDLNACMGALVSDLCALTGSDFAFIGEVIVDDGGRPALQVHADRAADVEEGGDIRGEHVSVMDSPYVEAVIERVITTGEKVISHVAPYERSIPSTDDGIIPIHNVLALPFSISDEVNGMVGLVNREGGYLPEFADTLKPVLVTCANLVHAHRSEMRRREAEDELKVARQRAEAASQAKSEFLANMSHEIRTPLTAIGGFAEILAEYAETDEIPQECTDAAITIKRNGEHLLGIINDILDLSRVEAGKMVVERLPIELKPFVEDVIGLMKLLAESAGLDLHVECETEIPEVICADPMRLRQILINLIGNSVKFTEVGGVTAIVRFDAKTTGGKLEIDIVDTGIGMTDEYDVGFYLKRARVAELTFGDASHHRDRFGQLQGY